MANIEELVGRSLERIAYFVDNFRQQGREIDVSD